MFHVVYLFNFTNYFTLTSDRWDDEIIGLIVRRCPIRYYTIDMSILIFQTYFITRYQHSMRYGLDYNFTTATNVLDYRGLWCQCMYIPPIAVLQKTTLIYTLCSCQHTAELDSKRVIENGPPCSLPKEKHWHLDLSHNRLEWYLTFGSCPAATPPCFLGIILHRMLINAPVDLIALILPVQTWDRIIIGMCIVLRSIPKLILSHMESYAVYI